MASASGFAVTISGTDQVSPVIAKINKGLLALQSSVAKALPTKSIANVNALFGGINKSIERTVAPLRRMRDTLGKTSQLTGLNAVSRSVASIGTSAVSATRSLTGLSPALAAIVGGASVAGLTSLASRWADWGQQLGFSAGRLGTNVAQLDAMQGAMRLVGGSSESVEGALNSLGTVMTDAVGGHMSEGAMYLRQFGIEFRGVGASARSVTSVLPEVLTMLGKIKDPFLQARVANSIFGGGADDMLKFVRSGGTFERYMQLAKYYGVINERAAGAAREFSMAQTELGLSVEGFGKKIAEKLLPQLMPLMKQLAGLIAMKGDAWAAAITKGVMGIVQWIQKINWTSVKDDLLSFLEGIKTAFAYVERIGNSPVFQRMFGAAPAAADQSSPADFARLDYVDPQTSNAAVAGSGIAQMPPSGDTDPNGPGMLRRFGQSFSHIHFGLPAKIPDASRALAERAANYYGVDPWIIERVMQTESHGNQLDPNTGRIYTSPAGAMGLMQLMPDTAWQYSEGGKLDPANAGDNTMMGTHYFADMLAQAHGNVLGAVAMYNAGPGRAAEYLRTGNPANLPTETQNYLQPFRAEGYTDPTPEEGAAGSKGSVDVNVTVHNKTGMDVSTSARGQGIAQMGALKVHKALEGTA